MLLKIGDYLCGYLFLEGRPAGGWEGEDCFVRVAPVERDDLMDSLVGSSVEGKNDFRGRFC